MKKPIDRKLEKPFYHFLDASGKHNMVKERSDEQIITSLVQLCIEKQPLLYTNCANYRVCFQCKTEQRHYVDADFDERIVN